MRSWVLPVTEISVFATENLVTGIKIFLYEHSSQYVSPIIRIAFIRKIEESSQVQVMFSHFGIVSPVEFHPGTDRAEILHVNREINSSPR